MSAVLEPLEAQFEAMTESWIAAICRVEESAYPHPWTRGNFSDSLKAGYHAQLLIGGAGANAQLLGYFVAMPGVAEVHLLNITVAPEYQRQGWARLMLDALMLWSRGQGAQWVWLEVRVSNTHARGVYERYGFRQVGSRRQYYPADKAGREDAVVMSMAVTAA